MNAFNPYGNVCRDFDFYITVFRVRGVSVPDNCMSGINPCDMVVAFLPPLLHKVTGYGESLRSNRRRNDHSEILAWLGYYHIVIVSGNPFV